MSLKPAQCTFAADAVVFSPDVACAASQDKCRSATVIMRPYLHWILLCLI
jgi:hypothetical protein